MEPKKYIFVLSHATTNPMEVIGLFKIALNMKAFDDTVELAFFLIGEGVQLAKKGVAKTISMEMEGKQVNVGELLETISELEVNFLRLPGLHAGLWRYKRRSYRKCRNKVEFISR